MWSRSFSKEPDKRRVTPTCLFRGGVTPTCLFRGNNVGRSTKEPFRPPTFCCNRSVRKKRVSLQQKKKRVHPLLHWRQPRDE
jgi:hypothetical protein